MQIVAGPVMMRERSRMRYPDHLIAAMYSSARQEIIERIKLRDQILAGYTVLALGVLAASAKDHELAHIALALPIAAFCASSLAGQHQEVIGAIGRYLATEFERDLRASGTPSSDKCRPEHEITQWDRSRSLLSLGARPFIRVMAAQLVILVAPLALSQWLCYGPAQHSGLKAVVAWYAGCVLSLATAYQVWRAVSIRKSLSRQGLRTVAHRLGYPARERDLYKHFIHFPERDGTWPA